MIFICARCRTLKASYWLLLFAGIAASFSKSSTLSSIAYNGSHDVLKLSVLLHVIRLPQAVADMVLLYFITAVLLSLLMSGDFFCTWSIVSVERPFSNKIYSFGDHSPFEINYLFSLTLV